MAGERLGPENYTDKKGRDYYLVTTDISRDVIKEHVTKIGTQISGDYEGKNLVMVGVLKGSFIFLADLARQTTIKDGTLEFDFVGVSSYDGTESSGKPKITKDIDVNVEGKDVLLVEDIIDTGYSLDAIQELFRLKGARSFEIAVLFTKPSRREKDVRVKYDGIKVED